jgi:Protein of unknown function (DUF3592)
MRENDHLTVKHEVSRLYHAGQRDEALGLLQSKYNVNANNAEKLLKVALDETASPEELFSLALTRSLGARATWYRMFAFGCGFLGIPLLLMAIFLYFYNQYVAERTDRVTGTILKVQEESDGDTIQQTLAISYEHGGVTYQFRKTIHAGSKSFAPGDPVSLLILQDDPEDVTLEDASHGEMALAIVALTGLILVSGMFYLSRQARRRQ